jgi:hypothetical protein
MQSCETTYDLRGTPVALCAPYARIRGLVNPLIWLEADTDRRVFMYVDSVVISQS